MREADSRLYEAKARGRNRVVFEEPGEKSGQAAA
jgi:PleD family two-component response regulator